MCLYFCFLNKIYGVFISHSTKSSKTNLSEKLSCHSRLNFLFEFYFLRHKAGSRAVYRPIDASARHVSVQSVEAPGFFEHLLYFVSIQCDSGCLARGVEASTV